MTQGEAVFQAVSQAFDVESGEAVPETVKWSEEQKRTVYGLVFSFFKSGQCQHKGNPTDEALLKYIPGLVNNWVRKDKRLNGGNAYQAKRPGSRTGSGDEAIRNMKLLLTTVTDAEAKAKIQAEIDTRLAALKPKVTIDVNALPEHLREYVRS